MPDTLHPEPQALDTETPKPNPKSLNSEPYILKPRILKRRSFIILAPPWTDKKRKGDGSQAAHLRCVEDGDFEKAPGSKQRERVPSSFCFYHNLKINGTLQYHYCY